MAITIKDINNNMKGEEVRKRVQHPEFKEDLKKSVVTDIVVLLIKLQGYKESLSIVVEQFSLENIQEILKTAKSFTSELFLSAILESKNENYIKSSGALIFKKLFEALDSKNKILFLQKIKNNPIAIASMFDIFDQEKIQSIATTGKEYIGDFFVLSCQFLEISNLEKLNEDICSSTFVIKTLKSKDANTVAIFVQTRLFKKWISLLIKEKKYEDISSLLGEFLLKREVIYILVNYFSFEDIKNIDEKNKKTKSYKLAALMTYVINSEVHFPNNISDEDAVKWFEISIFKEWLLTLSPSLKLKFFSEKLKKKKKCTIRFIELLTEKDIDNIFNLFEKDPKFLTEYLEKDFLLSVFYLRTNKMVFDTELFQYWLSVKVEEGKYDEIKKILFLEETPPLSLILELSKKSGKFFSKNSITSKDVLYSKVVSNIKSNDSINVLEDLYSTDSEIKMKFIEEDGLTLFGFLKEFDSEVMKFIIEKNGKDFLIFSSEVIWKFLPQEKIIDFIKSELFKFWLEKLIQSKKHDELKEILSRFVEDSKEYKLIVEQISLKDLYQALGAKSNVTSMKDKKVKNTFDIYNEDEWANSEKKIINFLSEISKDTEKNIELNGKYDNNKIVNFSENENENKDELDLSSLLELSNINDDVKEEINFSTTFQLKNLTFLSIQFPTYEQLEKVLEFLKGKDKSLDLKADGKFLNLEDEKLEKVIKIMVEHEICWNEKNSYQLQIEENLSTISNCFSKMYGFDIKLNFSSDIKELNFSFKTQKQAKDFSKGMKRVFWRELEEKQEGEEFIIKIRNYDKFFCRIYAFARHSGSFSILSNLFQDCKKNTDEISKKKLALMEKIFDALLDDGFDLSLEKILEKMGEKISNDDVVIFKDISKKLLEKNDLKLPVGIRKKEVTLQEVAFFQPQSPNDEIGYIISNFMNLKENKKLEVNICFKKLDMETIQFIWDEAKDELGVEFLLKVWESKNDLPFISGNKAILFLRRWLPDHNISDLKKIVLKLDDLAYESAIMFFIEKMSSLKDFSNEDKSFFEYWFLKKIREGKYDVIVEFLSKLPKESPIFELSKKWLIWDEKNITLLNKSLPNIRKIYNIKDESESSENLNESENDSLNFSAIQIVESENDSINEDNCISNISSFLNLPKTISFSEEKNSYIFKEKTKSFNLSVNNLRKTSIFSEDKNKNPLMKIFDKTVQILQKIDFPIAVDFNFNSEEEINIVFKNKKDALMFIDLKLIHSKASIEEKENVFLVNILPEKNGHDISIEQEILKFSYNAAILFFSRMEDKILYAETAKEIKTYKSFMHNYKLEAETLRNEHYILDLICFEMNKDISKFSILFKKFIFQSNEEDTKLQKKILEELNTFLIDNIRWKKIEEKEKFLAIKEIRFCINNRESFKATLDRMLEESLQKTERAEKKSEIFAQLMPIRKGSEEEFNQVCLHLDLEETDFDLKYKIIQKIIKGIKTELKNENISKSLEVILQNLSEEYTNEFEAKIFNKLCSDLYDCSIMQDNNEENKNNNSKSCIIC